MNITERTLKMLSKKGFIALFWDEVRTGKTQEEAYNTLETEYFKVFGSRRYANFKSFCRRRDKT